MDIKTNITLLNPSKVVFGNNCFSQFIYDFEKKGCKRLFVLTISALTETVRLQFETSRLADVDLLINDEIVGEPSFTDYQRILKQAREFKADSVVGIGGGSVLDTAKLIAATLNNSTDIREIIKDNSLLKRDVYLACLPTTAGTGSEMSPNAIFFDPDSNLKIGVISSALVADAAYIDPVLTIGVPPSVTAATGLDALTHCIEAYANKYAHPIIDLLALEGIKLIGRNLKNAYLDGNNAEAREKVALGSMYGGMCLGPVNTAAVHALAYPLGSIHKISHGISNAILLPHVMEFNLEAAIHKYAQVALAIGAKNAESDKLTALEGIKLIRTMIADFGIPSRLSDVDIIEKDIETMAHSALKIQRLLKNNLRDVSFKDATEIYRKAF